MFQCSRLRSATFIMSKFLKDRTSLINLLPSAAFVALKLEVTGNDLDDDEYAKRKNVFEDDMVPEERYEILRGLAERYSILQVGISIFHENEEFKAFLRKKRLVDEEDREHIDGIDNDSIEGNDREHEFEMNHEDSEENDEDIEPSEFFVNRFNFFLFPPSDDDGVKNRDVTLSPSIIASMKSRDCDFNKWLKEGASFVTIDEAESKVDSFREKYARKEELEKEKQSKKWIRKNSVMTQLTHQGDIAFVSRAMASLRKWIDDDPPFLERHISHPLSREEREINDGIAFQLPPCNMFLSRYLQETIEAEYPALSLEEEFDNGQVIIRVLRLESEEKAKRDKAIKKEEWDAMHCEFVGFTWVFKALIDALQGKLELQNYDDNDLMGGMPLSCNQHEKDKHKIPLIVHDGILDLLFLFRHFVAPLPPTWAECKMLLNEYFPTVYDTMVLSSEYSDDDVRNVTDLCALYFKYCFGESDNDEIIPPKVTVVNEGGENDSNQGAVYKSYMTGAVFLCLSRRKLTMDLKDADKVEYWRAVSNRKYDKFGSLLFLYENCQYHEMGTLFGRNKLSLHPTMFIADLEKGRNDFLIQGMDASTTFRVSGMQSHITGHLEGEMREVLLNVMNPEQEEDDMNIVHDLYIHILGNDCIVGIIWNDVNPTERCCKQVLERRSKYAKLIHSALKSLDSIQSIATMEDYINMKKQSRPPNAFYRVLDTWRRKKRRLDSDL